MASSIKRMGWKENSIEFYLDALSSRKKASVDPNSLLPLLTSVTAVLISCKNFDEALPYLEQKLSLQLEMSNNNNLQISKTIKSIAMIYAHQRKFTLAISHYEEALNMERDSLDVDITVRHETLNSLGRAYIETNEYHEAVHCFEKTLSIARSTPKLHKSHTARAHYLLGRSLLKVRDYSEALYHLSKSLAWHRKYHSKPTEDLAKILHSMGCAYNNMEKDEKNIRGALECLEECVDISEKILGAEHVHVGERLSDLAIAYERDNRIKKALAIRVDILNIMKSKYGEKDIKIVDALSNLGHMYEIQNNFEEALFSYKAMYEVMTQCPMVEPESIESNSLSKVASVLYKIGRVFFSLESYESALSYSKKAYSIRLEYFSEEHAIIAESQLALGLIFFSMNHDEKALKYFNLALERQKIISGKECEKVANILYNMALVHRNHFEYHEALSLAREAHKICQKVYGTKHVKVADAKYLMGVLLYHVGKYSLALQFYNDALFIYKKIGYKETHPDILANASNWVSFLEEQLFTKQHVTKSTLKTFSIKDSFKALKNESIKISRKSVTT